MSVPYERARTTDESDSVTDHIEVTIPAGANHDRISILGDPDPGGAQRVSVEIRRMGSLVTYQWLPPSAARTLAAALSAAADTIDPPRQETARYRVRIEADAVGTTAIWLDLASNEVALLALVAEMLAEVSHGDRNLVVSRGKATRAAESTGGA